jgi:hypothetical protein
MTDTDSGRPYEELVAEGQQAVLAQTGLQWKLGDLAIEHRGLAGDKTAKGTDVGLKQYAEDIGVDYNRLTNYRLVASAWPEPTRVGSVPWVCYRTIYKAPRRAIVMRDFIAHCEDQAKEKDRKPSFRNFQRFLGHDVTREYTRKNAKETAGQALEDLPVRDKVDVITPEVQKPEVARDLVQRPGAREAIQEAQGNLLPDPMFDPPENTRLDLLSQYNQEAAHLRMHWKRIYDIAGADELVVQDREVMAQSLRTIADQFALLVDVLEAPEGLRLTDEDLAGFLGGAV